MLRMKIRKKNVYMKWKRKGAETVRLRQLRQALAASAVSLVLCCAMLAGTTYAWLAESIVSGHQTIQGGNLDVRLRYRRSLDDEWKQIPMTGSKALEELKLDEFFSDKIWNAGEAEYLLLEVTNTGSLPVVYGFSVEEGFETGNLDWLWTGCISDKWYESEAYSQATPSNAQMIALTEEEGDSCPISEGFEVMGELEAADGESEGESAVITLVIYMPMEQEDALLMTADAENDGRENGTFTICFQAKQPGSPQEMDEEWTVDGDVESGRGPGMEAEEH